MTRKFLASCHSDVLWLEQNKGAFKSVKLLERLPCGDLYEIEELEIVTNGEPITNVVLGSET